MVLADSFYYQPVQIDTINTRVNADLFAKEGDANGRGMVVQITENGMIKDTTGITLRLQWSHISVVASGFTDFEVVDATKGLYKVKYPTSMLHRGKVEAFIRITDNGILSGTRNLLITVERMVGSDETIEASDDFSALQTALIQLDAWNVTIGGKVDTWEADMEATKQLYIDTLTAAEAAYPQELVSLQGQLAETLNKSAITLTHMFADATARDAYFVAHPAELIELQFIKVGTAYQQYIEGVWTDSVPIVSEQLSATNQPIMDTGNYFTTDNTNAALQELGAHKASATNPHGVTKTQLGLGNVDNTSDANKPVSTAGQTALNLKANKAQEAWITPTLIGLWVTDAFAPQYMKDEMGFVHFRGMMKGGTMTSVSFVLPLGYRPERNSYIPVYTVNAGSFIVIFSSGEVILYSGSTARVSLDGVTFKAV